MDTFHPLIPLCEVYRISKNSRQTHPQRAKTSIANKECTDLRMRESFPDGECVPFLLLSANFPLILQGLESQAFQLPQTPPPLSPDSPTATPIQPALTLFSPQVLGVLSPSSFMAVHEASFKTSHTGKEKNKKLKTSHTEPPAQSVV